jgi:hypothetical protein
MHVYIYRQSWKQFLSWSVINFYLFEDFSLPRLKTKLSVHVHLFPFSTVHHWKLIQMTFRKIILFLCS